MKEMEKLTWKSFKNSSEGRGLVVGLTVGVMAMFFTIICPALVTSVSAEAKAEDFVYTTSAQVEDVQVVEKPSSSIPKMAQISGKTESYVVENEEQAIQIAKTLGPDVETVSWQQVDDGRYLIYVIYESPNYSYK